MFIRHIIISYNPFVVIYFSNTGQCKTIEYNTALTKEAIKEQYQFVFPHPKTLSYESDTRRDDQKSC